MTALAVDSSVEEFASAFGMGHELPVEASTTIFVGSMVALNAAGFVVPVTTSTTLIIAGVSQENVDNSAGAQGAVRCRFRSGIFLFINDGSTPVDDADRGDDVFGLDDATITADATGRSVAGFFYDFETRGGAILVAVAIKFPIN